MILTVKPARNLRGHIHLPASKSYTIRAFLIAACGGRSRIVNPSDCDDALVALAVARNLGAKVSGRTSRVLTAQSMNLRLKDINVKESGTVLRFLLPLLAHYGRSAKVTGTGTLRNRPNHHLTRLLRSRGTAVRGRGNKECVPIRFSGGTFRPGTMVVEGTLSSQFISALLIACPRLDNDSRVVIKGRTLVSADYITMTDLVLKQSGVRVKRLSPRRYTIRGKQRFKGLKHFIVPSDYGLAAFLLAAAALVKSRLVLKGHLSERWVQADGHILKFLRHMGVRFQKTAKVIRISGPFQLKGGTFSLKRCPDLVPIMAVLALFARGRTRLTDIRHVRAKESDRISDLRRELLKVGAKVRETANSLTIDPQPQYKAGVHLDPHHDHRLAMAFSILGLKIGVRVKDITCVSKSYPGFVRDLRALGAAFSKK